MLSEVLSIYAEEHAVTAKDPVRILSAIDALLPFWGKLTASTVKAETCRRYGKYRVTSKGLPPGQTRAIADATIRRELGTLRAAIGYCHSEGYLLTKPPVTLPPKPAAKDRWLSRDEVARLIRAARQSKRAKHLAHFILIGLYTGTRKDAVLRLHFHPNTIGGWIDAEHGLLYRRGVAERTSKKRQPPARLPNRLLAHVKRWVAKGDRFPVQYQGGRCGDIKTAWTAIAEAAGMPDVTPHTLRHTAITWAMQRGAAIWDVAGFFGASVETIENTYGHHHPDHQESARKAMDQR
jgi:integrase